jgi:hypothetical protein
MIHQLRATLHKEDARMTNRDYRPVSFLSPFSKALLLFVFVFPAMMKTTRIHVDEQTKQKQSGSKRSWPLPHHSSRSA